MYYLRRKELGSYAGGFPSTGSWRIGRWDCAHDLVLGELEGGVEGERAGLDVAFRFLSLSRHLPDPLFVFVRFSYSSICSTGPYSNTFSNEA